MSQDIIFGGLSDSVFIIEKLKKEMINPSDIFMIKIIQF